MVLSARWQNGSDYILWHQERRQNKGPARDDGRAGGVGFGTPTFESRNEAKHNVRVRTWKKKPKTNSEVQNPRTPPGVEVPKGKQQEGTKVPRMKQDPPGLILLETVPRTVLPLCRYCPTATHPTSNSNITCDRGIVLYLDNRLCVHQNKFSSI